MEGISLDLGGVERPKWTPLPEGEYSLVLSDLQVKPSKTDQKPIAHCTYEVVSPEEHAGRKVKHFQQLQPATENMGYLKVWLESHVGEPLDGEFSFDPDDFIGKHVDCYIVQAPDNRDSTKTQNKISYFVLPFEIEE